MPHNNSSKNSAKVEAVLCDLDGTLIDSNALHAKAWCETFQHFGISVSFDQALHQIGKGGDQLLPVFVPPGDLERLSKPITEFRKKLFESKYFDQAKAFPHCRELLSKMKTAGIRIAISSSASKKDLTRLKEIAAITDLVDEETSSDDADQSKPSPDIFQVSLERLGLSPEQCLALGDTPWDVQAAAKAGVQTVAVTSGGWEEGELRSAGALEVYRDVEQLSQQFEQSAFCRGRH